MISTKFCKLYTNSFSLECVETDHVADGYCDDIANTEICNWDGGDCCGTNPDIEYCTECQCQETTAAPPTAAPPTAPTTAAPTTAPTTTTAPPPTAPTTVTTTAPPSTYTSGTATATTAGGGGSGGFTTGEPSGSTSQPPGGCTTGWITDGYCDDINNNMDCNYDGGDCCGCNVNTAWCTECQCLDPNGIGGGTTCPQTTTSVPTTTVSHVPGSFGKLIEQFF